LDIFKYDLTSGKDQQIDGEVFDFFIAGIFRDLYTAFEFLEFITADPAFKSEDGSDVTAIFVESVELYRKTGVAFGAE